MLCYDPDSACPDASTLYDNSVCYATRLRILGSAGLLKQIACSTIAMSRDVGRGCDALQGEGEQEESSLISVRSRRSRAKRRPRPQQPEQAPASASAQAPAAAAAAAHALAPDTAGSHMPQHAHKRARMEPVRAPGRTGAGALQQASAARPAQAFTPVGTPQRLSTPEAAEIRSDMIAQNAPGSQHDFHASGSRTPQLASQQRSTPPLTPGQQDSLLTSTSLLLPRAFICKVAQ